MSENGLTLLVLPNKQCLSLAITSPITQISLSSDSEIPDKILELVQSNGSLKPIPEDLEVRVIPEGKGWES